MRGLIGKKLGMSQIFDHQGNRVPVTVVELGPCKVIRKKTTDAKDGYDAVLLGFGTKKESRLNKPDLGQFKRAGVAPSAVVREFRMKREFVNEVDVGDELTVAMFQIGDLVDVVGTSKGSGFTGVMKRHNMAGARRTHGVHEYFRHGGSIGMATYPGRVVKGKRMAGQHGNARVTVQNLRVVGVVESANLLLIRGAIPGARNSFVKVKAAIKSEIRRAHKATKAAAQA